VVGVQRIEWEDIQKKKMNVEIKVNHFIKGASRFHNELNEI
jgi:hypothetical protein